MIGRAYVILGENKNKKIYRKALLNPLKMKINKSNERFKINRPNQDDNDFLIQNSFSNDDK